MWKIQVTKLKSRVIKCTSCYDQSINQLNCWICFFIGAAVRIAVLVSWHTTPVSLPGANLMICSLKFKKEVVILKIPLWIFFACGFKAVPKSKLSHFHYG